MVGEVSARDRDVIVSDNQPAAHAARAATATIPIVSLISGDPVAAGLAERLAAPGNLTGVSYYATELTAKRLERDLGISSEHIAPTSVADTVKPRGWDNNNIGFEHAAIWSGDSIRRPPASVTPAVCGWLQVPRR